MVQKYTNNKNIRKKNKKTMRGGSNHKKRNNKRTKRKYQKGGARSNYCLYSSKNFGTECSNWDGIVMLTKGLEFDEYLYTNKFLNRKSVKGVRYGTSKEVIKKAIEYANDYLGIFKLSFFIKTIQTFGDGIKNKFSSRNYEEIRGRYSPRGFWNGIKNIRGKDDKFRNDELEDYETISKDLIDKDITFSINDLLDKTPWFMKITNLKPDDLQKDSPEYVSSIVGDKAINLSIGTTGGEKINLETEMQVMKLNDFITRTFGEGTNHNSLLSQRNSILKHIEGQLSKNFCGSETIEESLGEYESACKNAMGGKKGFLRKISNTSHESRKPHNIPAIKKLYESFEEYIKNMDTSVRSPQLQTDQELEDNPVEYLTDKEKNREEYKLLSFDPFTNYHNIENMTKNALDMNVGDLNVYVFGATVSTGKRGIIQLEEFNYEILFKNKKSLLDSFSEEMTSGASDSQLTPNIKKFYEKSNIANNEKSDEFQVILDSDFNHPLLIDHIIVNNVSSKEYAIVTPYYHLLKVSQKLQGKVSGSWGIGNDYHKYLCIEYLKFMMCKRFVGDILDMYIYKYKNTMSHPRIGNDISGDHNIKIDNVKSRDYQSTTDQLISNAVKRGYSEGELTAADIKPDSVLGQNVPSSDPSFDELEEFKKKLYQSLTYDELVDECKKMNIDISNVESSTADEDDKKKQLIILLIDKIFPSGMDLSQMIRHNEFIMKNNSNPVEGFIRDSAYKNVSKTHELKDGVLVSKRDISSEKIIPDKTFIRNKRIQMKCPFCGNLSVDFTKSKSSDDGSMKPSNYDDGAYYYYCNNSDCRAFLGAFYRKKDSSENKKGKGQIDGQLNNILNQKLTDNFNFQDVDVYPNDGSVKNEIPKLRYQYSQSHTVPQYNPADPQANSQYYQAQDINQMNPAQQMFTMDGAAQVGQQIGQSPPMQGWLGNINPFANTDPNAAMAMQSQIMQSPDGWKTSNDPNAQPGPGPQDPVFAMGRYAGNAPGFGNDPNAQMGPTSPVNLTSAGTPVPMPGFGNLPGLLGGPMNQQGP